MQYMIRFTQVHETFRLAEIKALAELEKIDLKILSYDRTVSALSKAI
jgi:tRNA (guanine10-N2)-methyltransferase